jgi:hypothetical protein
MDERRTRDHREGSYGLTGGDQIETELSTLLAAKESLPEAVLSCARRIEQLGIWRRFSRNSAATSCNDAARKRDRLGHTGIPLWDELKSFLGEYSGESGERRVFLAHCRGDRELDLEKLRHALEFTGEVRRVLPEAAESLGAVYGTVQPFTGRRSHSGLRL